jgi:hypothetical protein
MAKTLAFLAKTRGNLAKRGQKWPDSYRERNFINKIESVSYLNTTVSYG